MTWIVVGASTGLGRALSECLAQEGKSLLLVSRDPRDLNSLASDLRIRFEAEVSCVCYDAEDHVGLANLLGGSIADGNSVEGIMFPIGYVEAGDRCDLSSIDSERLVKVNFLSIVSVISKFLPGMIEEGKGVLVGFGSIAGTRGRAGNAVYSATKRALQSYFESLRHRCERNGLLIQFYILGYMDSNLAFGQNLLLPKADPGQIAKSIIANLRKGGGTRFLPAFWKSICLLVRAIPWFIFKRMQF